MDLAFDLLMGAGIAAGIGIRPFLPVLLVGALAAGDIGVDFDGTDFAFLEQAALLAVVVVLLALSIYLVRRRGPGALEVQPWAYLFGVYAVVMRILYAAGVMAEYGAALFYAATARYFFSMWFLTLLVVLVVIANNLPAFLERHGYKRTRQALERSFGYSPATAS